MNLANAGHGAGIWARAADPLGPLKRIKKDWKSWKDWKDWSRDPHTPVPEGRQIYPVRCARQAATVPNLRLEIEESCLKNLSNSVQNSRKNR